MRELLPVAAARLTCPECEMHDLEAAEARGAEDADWPAARRCESCGAVISPERLEVFPHTELCPACLEEHRQEQEAQEEQQEV